MSRCLHADVIRLIGGEPLLNPEINSFLAIAKESGIADRLMVTTNGLLLHSMNADFWKLVDCVLVNLYPGIRLKESIDEFKLRAKMFGARLCVRDQCAFRISLVTSPHPNDWITDMIFRTCKNAHVFQCHMVHEGKLYKCAVPPFLPEYLLKLGINGYDPNRDAFNFREAKDLLEALKRFLLSPATMDSCRFCLGYVGKPQPHHQLEPKLIAEPALQQVTRSGNLDHYVFIRECAHYYWSQALAGWKGRRSRQSERSL
ncbi:hypothetical protein HZA56_04860 [Candidatus Poribacteria bacterium]|nr:hypothetical protein [Candidatus Poribacteria bacterium]